MPLRIVPLSLAITLAGGAALAGGLSPTMVALPWSPTGTSAQEYLGGSLAPAGDVDGDGDGDLLFGLNSKDPKVDQARLFPGSTAGPALVPAWTYASGQAAGSYVAPAGDVNGDGYADVLVGLPLWTEGGLASSGKVVVFHGGPAGLPPVPTKTLFSPLPAANQEFGHAVATAGDVNGDGHDDVIVGAYRYASGGFDARGAAFVFHGGPSGLASSPARSLFGGDENGYFGTAVATAGDVDGDGYADVLIGIPNSGAAFFNGGAVALHRGSAGGVLAAADTTILGPGVNAFCGSSVSTAGDVNGDDHADILYGSPGYDGQAGQARLVFGTAQGLGAGLTLSNANASPGERFGRVVATLGDLNGDHYADIGVSAKNQPAGTGRVSVFLGGPALPGYAGEALPSGPVADMGFAMATSGDANGDGFAEMLAGDPFVDTGGSGSQGRVHMFALPRRVPRLSDGWPRVGAQPGTRYGAALAILPFAGAASSYGSLAVGDPQFDGFGRVSFHGGITPGGLYVPETGSFAGTTNFQSLGARIVDAGDMNRDGFTDFAVSSTTLDDGPVFQAGRVDFHPGGQPPIPPSVPILAGGRDFDRVGTALAGRGDVNGDGYHDLLVGAWEWDSAALADCGKAWLFLGGPGGPGAAAWTREGSAIGQGLGSGVALGDLDGDGYSDVIVGSSSPPAATPLSGRVEVFYGGAGGPAATPGLVLEPLTPSASFASTVASLGDVTADGICDLGVGAPQENGVGRVRVYAGTRGRSQSDIPVWTRNGTQAGGRFGAALAGGGDVDGDGRGDLVIGEPGWDGGQVDEGRIHLHHGAPFVPEPAAAWTVEADVTGAELGASFAPLRDVSQDGFADIVAGAPGAAGRVYPFLGGGGQGRKHQIMLRESFVSFTRRFPPARLDDPDDVGAGISLRSAAGRTRATFQIELAIHNEPFTGSATHTGSFYFDTGTPGTLAEVYPDLHHAWGGRGLHVRGRALGRSPYFQRTRWLTVESHASGDLDVRAAGAVVDAGASTPGRGAAEARLAGVTPNPSAGVASRIAFVLPRAARLTLDVIDVRGARVRRVHDGDAPSGPGAVTWDGRDAQGRTAPAGLYFIVLDAGGRRDHGRIVRLP